MISADFRGRVKKDLLFFDQLYIFYFHFRSRIDIDEQFHISSSGPEIFMHIDIDLRLAQHGTEFLPLGIGFYKGNGIDKSAEDKAWRFMRYRFDLVSIRKRSDPMVFKRRIAG